MRRALLALVLAACAAPTAPDALPQGVGVWRINDDRSWFVRRPDGAMCSFPVVSPMRDEPAEAVALCDLLLGVLP